MTGLRGIHFRCKCGRSATIVHPDDSDRPTLLHELPTCDYFDRANTPDAMLRLAWDSLTCMCGHSIKSHTDGPCDSENCLCNGYTP